MGIIWAIVMIMAVIGCAFSAYYCFINHDFITASLYVMILGLFTILNPVEIHKSHWFVVQGFAVRLNQVRYFERLDDGGTRFVTDAGNFITDMPFEDVCEYMKGINE